MTIDRSAATIRSLIIYSICLPLAFFLGYLVLSAFENPRDLTSAYLIGGCVFVLALPLLMRWYHAWLIVIWNSAVVVMFLPGTLNGWQWMAPIACMIAVGHYILNRDRTFLGTPSVTWSLVLLAVVVGVTAKFRGGIGLHVLGDESVGGKRYIIIWAAIMGYFALTSQAIEPRKRKLMAVLFVLSGATAIIGDLCGMFPAAFGWIGEIFPLSSGAVSTGQHGLGQLGFERFGGIGNGGLAIACTLLVCYGVEGTLNLRKLWRPLLFVGALFLSTFGGSRAMLIMMIMVFAFQFYFEGLLRSRLMPVMVLCFMLFGSLLVAFPRHFPMTFQRCVAFLPIDIDPFARMSAESSSDWRLEIWESLLPKVPRYLWLGKGLGMDLDDLASYYYFGNSQVGGEVGGGFTLATDYHNGPLSLIIPFGIWGVIAFLWFLGAGIRVLWRNYKYGDPDVKHVNSFLLASFLAKIIMFCFVFGGFYGDVMTFIGIVGLSVSLNGGVAKRVAAVRRPVVFDRFRQLRTAAT